jgi:hypothetical protein
MISRKTARLRACALASVAGLGLCATISSVQANEDHHPDARKFTIALFGDMLYNALGPAHALSQRPPRCAQSLPLHPTAPLGSDGHDRHGAHATQIDDDVPSAVGSDQCSVPAHWHLA